MPEAQALLPLDQPRVIPIRDGKFIYTFHFGRISQEDWLGYFRGIDYTTRNAVNSEEVTLDTDSALALLAEKKLEGVEGYAGDFMSKDGWRTKIPPRHLRPVALQLIDVTPSSTDSDRPFDPDSVEIALDAKWSNVGYSGLLHRFSPVTVEQKRLFYRAGATARVIKGGRNGITVHGMRHSALLKIYDENIQSVDGYRTAHAQLTDDRDVIRREMDAMHKVRAAEQLFAGVSGPAAAQETEAA